MHNDEGDPAFSSLEEFEHAFRTLQPGAALSYHVGFLANDREEKGKSEDTPITLLGRIANAAMQLEQEGRAELVQRRLDWGAKHSQYEYIIHKRREVNEEAACDWKSFGSRVRQRDRRNLPIRQLPAYHYDLRQSFFQRNKHLV